MNIYKPQNIRNICLLGHGGDGKSSLLESLLFVTKATDRLGKIVDGNTVSDYDPEEIRRKISVSASIAPVEFASTKINIIDTPGYFDFVGEVFEAVSVADTACILLTAKSGVQVGTEKAWTLVNEKKLPRMFYISKLDEENANFFHALDGLKDKFGVSVCPVVIPVLEGEKAVGVIDIVNQKAYNPAGAEMPIPASMTAKVEECISALSEGVAETGEDLMEKFFSGEAFTPAELIKGLKEGVAAGSIAPVFCGSGFTGLGTNAFLQGIVSYAPNPAEGQHKVTESGDNTAFVFKTVSDQYGKFSFFKVTSGKVADGSSLTNLSSGQSEKMAHLFYPMGKKHIDTPEVTCGDIGAVAKLAATKTCDTLSSNAKAEAIPAIKFPNPTFSLAVFPKTKGGEEKIATGLSKMREEDLTFTTLNNAETRQFVVTAYGDMQIDLLCSRLKNKFQVDVDTEAPRVPYREKIRAKVKEQGRHKKQSGGHGQFGDVVIEFEPNYDQEDLVFEEKIVGGAVPRQYFPAVEKGLRECISKGVLAGFPVVNLKATLVFGSYHDVDSSEMAFKMAARLAYKAALPKANPVILEPIGKLAVTIPDSYMGDVIGDLNKRRGRVLGMNPIGNGLQIVEAEVPMAEMNTYTIDLRSMTQGRGSFEFAFERYEETPMNIQQKVIEERKEYLEADDE